MIKKVEFVHLPYTTKFEENIYLYFGDDDIWTTASSIMKLFHLTSKKMKTLCEEILAGAFQPELFQMQEMQTSEWLPMLGLKKKETFFNMNLILAIGYRTDLEEADRLFADYKYIMKKYTGRIIRKLDPDVTGKGRIYIQYGDMEEAIYNTDVYFRNTYLDEWFEDPLVIKMIKDIDRATVVDKGIINSFVLGKIPPTELSGGVKTLILLYKDHEHIYNVSTCGDNCAKWILKLADMGNITINLRHIMDFGDGIFDAVILNNGKAVHSMSELVQYAGYYV